MSRSDLYEDAELYALQYRAYRDDLAFYRELALDRPGRVLELGAGDGRVTVELARLAEQVVALEPAASMRSAASDRLRAADLLGRVELRDQDARTLDEDGSFALAVAPFHMLNELLTLADQDAVLTAVRRALAPGGAFACDVLVPDFGPAGVLRRETTWRDAAGRDAELWLLQDVDPVAQIVESHYLLDRTDDAGRVVRTRRRLVQRWLHRFELVRALRQAGFAQVRIFGGFDRRPVDATATRYVALATVAASST